MSAKSLGIFEFFYRNVYRIVLHVSCDFSPKKSLDLIG